MKIALIVVDMQNDFMPGGALAVGGGNEIIDPINRLMEAGSYDLIVASQDWHPADHVSFASTHGVAPFSRFLGKVVWPNHCIAGTRGALLHEGLTKQHIDQYMKKATLSDRDDYSAFDNTSLDQNLRENGVTAVDVVGLAFDYCVRATALDAAKNGYSVRVLKDYTRSVFPENDEQVTSELESAGAKVISH